MKLFIDESGNTGETLTKNSNFNFTDQPFYVLSGVLMDDKMVTELEDFILAQKTKYHIQGDELKAKNLYNSKPKFVAELVDFIIAKEIPFFIELMDKVFYLNIQLLDYFLIPYYSLPFENKTFKQKRLIASGIGQYLNHQIYESLIITIKQYSNVALEGFYDILIHHFESINQPELKMHVEKTRTDYFEHKEIDPEDALKRHLPIPDENPKKRLIHLLPNFNAFTNLIARAQKFDQDFLTNQGFTIIHDEQKQFDVIFESAFETMKNSDTDIHAQGTMISDKATFNLTDHLSLKFIDSKQNLSVQVADLLSGLIARFWNDYLNKDEQKVNIYLSTLKKLHYPKSGSTIGINYVVPDFNYNSIMNRYNG